MERNGKPELTCFSCPFWHKLERQERGPVDMSLPVQGDCRGAPPTPIVVVTPRGLQQVAALYPTLDAENPACALHPKAGKKIHT